MIHPPPTSTLFPYTTLFRSNVFVPGYVPARAVVVPALADGDDFSQFAASDDFPHPVLIRATEPLRSHLHHLLARQDRGAGQLGVFQGIRQWLLAIAVLAGSYYLRQDSRVLVIAGPDHHRVQIRIGQHLLGVLKGLGPL